MQKHIKEKSILLKEVFDKQEELANLKQEHSQLLTKLEYFNTYAQELNVDMKPIELIDSGWEGTIEIEVN